LFFIIVGSALYIYVAVSFIKGLTDSKAPGLPLSKQERFLRRFSFILSGAWIIGILPATGFSFIAGVAAVMTTDSGHMSGFQTSIICLSMCLFFATPVLAVIGMISAAPLRKKGRFKDSVWWQLSPVFSGALAFLLLFLTA
jgi:hypothetical protein